MTIPIHVLMLTVPYGTITGERVTGSVHLATLEWKYGVGCWINLRIVRSDNLLTCVCSNSNGLLKGEVVFQLPI